MLPLISLGCCFALSSMLTFQGDNFPDSPTNHWAYEAVSDLKSYGVLVGFPDGLGRGVRPNSRFEMAVAVNAACIRLHAIVGDIERINGEIARSKASADQAKDLEADLTTRGRPLKPAIGRLSGELHRLLTTFDSELKALGVDPKATDGQVSRDASMLAGLRVSKPGEALEQFSDVPAGHWAASAVNNLRRNGIVRGYPDGKFNR